MKTAKTPLIAAVAAALLAWGGASIAAAPATDAAAATQSAAPALRHQRMHGKHMDREQWQQLRAQRSEAFKARLQLSDAQQPAWDAFQQAMQPQPHARLDFADLSRLTTPERIDRMRAVRVQRDAEADRRGDAVKTFYAALTPEQQKTFDAQQMRRGPRAGGPAHGRHHPGHGGPGMHRGNAPQGANPAS